MARVQFGPPLISLSAVLKVSRSKKGKLAIVKLEKGKRYSFSIMIPSDGRNKSGLFTGEYDKNGNAILVSKDGSVWSIPPENCIKGFHAVAE